MDGESAVKIMSVMHNVVTGVCWAMLLLAAANKGV